MKAEITKSNPHQASDPGEADSTDTGAPDVLASTIEKEDALSDAEVRTTPNTIAPNIPLAHGMRSDADTESAAIAQDILSLPTAPLTAQDAHRKPNILSKFRALIPSVGLDDRAGRAVLSILLAFLLWFYVVNLENPAQTTVFNDLTVDVRGLGSGLKLVNTLNQNSVTVQAPQNALNVLRPSNIRPYIDLTGVAAGVHTVPIRVEVSNNPSGSLDISANPDTVQVQLEIESSRDIPVQVQVTGTPPFGYGVDPAQVNPGTVRITGAQDLVARVSKVVASVNIDEKGGTQRGARRPVALDENGAEITGLIFEPAQVEVVVPIKLKLDYKVVGVRADTRGQPAPGYRVSAITTDPNTVTICCSPTVLSNTQFLDTLPVLISGSTFNIITQTQLLLPDGVELYPGQTKTISVTVDIEPLVTTLQVSVAPTIEGTAEGTGVVVSPDRLDLTLSGTFDQLQDLKPTDVRVFINVQGRGPGTYELRPQVIVPQGVKLEKATPDTVTVTLIAPTPVPTQTPTPESTITPIPTPTLQTTHTPTHTPTVTVTATTPTPVATPLERTPTTVVQPLPTRSPTQSPTISPQPSPNP